MKLYKKILTSITVVLTFTLTSCSTLVKTDPVPISKTPEVSWVNYSSKLKTLSYWYAEGVVGVVINNKGSSANYRWSQDGKDDFSLRIYGPLGIGSTTFKGDKYKVTIQKSNGQIKSADTVEELMSQEMGWQIPIKGLYYWVKGTLVPDKKYSLKLNKFGLPKNIKQLGWSIDYYNYAIYDSKYPLPGKMVLHYNDLKLTAIINSWSLKK